MDGSQKLDTSTPVVVLAPGYHGHGVARSLGRLGIPVYGVHGDPHSPAARSRYWTRNFFWNVSTAEPADSVNRLQDIARSIGSRPILLATDDAGCLLIADHSEALSQEFLLAHPPAGITRALSSKEHMYDLCKRYSVPTAETLFPKTRAEVLASLSTLTFPVMIKLIDNSLSPPGRWGTKAILDDASSLVQAYDQMQYGDTPNIVLQEYIPGTDAAMWLYNGYFNKDSVCLFGETARKIRLYPPYYGLTSLAECIPNDVVSQYTERLMKATEYWGALDIEYKYDTRDGEYKLLDVNPRLGAPFRLFVDTEGVDVVRALYADLTGQSISLGTAQIGRKWILEPFDLLSSYSYWRDGNLSFQGWLQSLRGIQEESWFARDDLTPFFAIWGNTLRKGFRRVRAALSS